MLALEVLPWPIWGSCEPRPYPYGFWGFIFLIIIGIIYLATMWIVGILFYRTYRIVPRREYKLLSVGVLSVALFDTMHVIGDILFFVMNDSRAPIRLNSVEFYFMPFATSLSVMGIIIFYICLFHYGKVKLGEGKNIKYYVFMMLALIGIVLGFNPYNFWHMMPPSNVLDTKPITGTLLLVVGIISLAKFYGAVKRVVFESMRTKPYNIIRMRLLTMSVILMFFLVFLMIPHAMLAMIQEDWAKTLMVAITGVKLLSLGLSAFLLYVSIIWPDWFKRFVEK